MHTVKVVVVGPGGSLIDRVVGGPGGHRDGGGR